MNDAVDLDRLDRELPEVQRAARRSVPKSSSARLHAEAAQPSEQASGERGILEDQRSVTSNASMLGRRCPLASIVRSMLAARSLVTQLGGREVDPHDERSPLGVRGGPLGRLTARLGADPRPDRADQAALLGDLEERAGGRSPLVGMRPAQQRLEAGERVVLERDHRLVVERERTVVDCALRSVALDVEPRHDALPQLVVEDLGACSTALLRPVHRGIGVAQDALRGDCRSTIAIPMLAVTTTSLPSIGERLPARPRARGSRARYASNSVPICSQTMTNSSPPKRATRSPGRSATRSRAAHLDEQARRRHRGRRCR